MPRGVHINVHEGERVRAGEQLMDGPSDPHDILRVLAGSPSKRCRENKRVPALDRLLRLGGELARAPDAWTRALGWR